jgi:hypothetical protein
MTATHTAALHIGSKAPCLNQNLGTGVIVECKRCGEPVALVQSRAGKWYTAELTDEMRPRWRPGHPHFKVCASPAG